MSLRIMGTGSYLPEYVLSNRELETFLDTSDEWIYTRTGMRERRISMGEPTWRMGELAARGALDAAGIPPEEIDVILCSTVTGDFNYPSCSCMIQGALGAKNAFAMDVAAACTGSVYALDMANRYLATGFDTVLVVGAETLSQQVDYSDRGNCILFGDGAGAAVLKRGDGIYGAALHSDPSGAGYLYSAKSRRELPFGKQSGFDGAPFAIENDDHIVMDGRAVYKFATKAMPEAVTEACERAGIGLEELDLIIPHQANIRIIETAAKNLGIPMEKVYSNIELYGNSSSATIMICLDECVRAKRIARGSKLCLVGFGSGLTYGAVVIEV